MRAKAFCHKGRFILDRVAPKTDVKKDEKQPDEDAQNKEFACSQGKNHHEHKDVRLSKTLTDSPVTAPVADEEGMDIQIETADESP